MAPLRIRCVVSFSSQDPKYPVENLLLEERAQPWLCCPLDRSRQLRAELQLEQAGCIGYIDVGNSGSAFLQIEVGRSSWPPDQHYLTLLPTTTLMMPADAKQDRNRSGVRMFKEGDLLASALAEKWDRVRLTCSQPFNRHAQFGLAFIHIRTPEDSEERRGDPAAPSPCQASPESAPKLGVFRGTLSPAEPSCSTQEETLLKSQLQQLDCALLGKGLSPSGLSRPARLVLKAAASAHKRAPLLPAGSPPPAARSKEAGRAPRAAQSPRAPRPKEEQPARSSRLKTKRRSQGGARRARNGSRREGRTRSLRGKPPTWESEEEEGGGEAALGTCPICTGRFPAELLPVHASACGEEVEVARASSSPVWGSWVECPLCQDRFPASEVEGHASGCGEEYA
ncbi:protein XNDC1N [Pantherophis guttatus]|uniref:Protein XNDC1N n=1 Tax=Pantherophis guttatus TaxID=94885 RepID=A0A6P9D9K0_PANGU|nr:protein XNDC1N [Pantherophis guttatus]